MPSTLAFSQIDDNSPGLSGGEKVVNSQYDWGVFTSEVGVPWVMDADGADKGLPTSYNEELIGLILLKV